MDVGKNTVFPDYVAEETPESLRLAMFENNVKYGVQFVYSNIQFVDGLWYAWFHVEVDNEQLFDLIENNTQTSVKKEE